MKVLSAQLARLTVPLTVARWDAAVAPLLARPMVLCSARRKVAPTVACWDSPMAPPKACWLGLPMALRLALQKALRLVALKVLLDSALEIPSVAQMELCLVPLRAVVTAPRLVQLVVRLGTRSLSSSGRALAPRSVLQLDCSTVPPLVPQKVPEPVVRTVAWKVALKARRLAFL